MIMISIGFPLSRFPLSHFLLSHSLLSYFSLSHFPVHCPPEPQIRWEPWVGPQKAPNPDPE